MTRRLRLDRPHPLRAGAVPVWIPLLAVVLLFAAGVRAMERRAQSEGYGWVDPASLEFEAFAEWVDERWTDQLDELLLDSPLFRTDDAEAVAALEAALEDLPFVREAFVEEVLWPGGLEVELELREPVACIPVGRHFLPVSDEGVVLPGLWTRPPLVSGRFLPVIAPLEDAYGVFAHARAGDWLAETRHLDALSIVRSARAHLTDETSARLGRFSVLAVDARVPAIEAPGAMLLLEGGRRVWFGRPPADDLLGVPVAPGELPVAVKWESLTRALALLEPGPAGDPPQGQWERVDVRWDRPELLLDATVLLALAEAERLESLPAEVPRPSYQPTPPSASVGERSGPEAPRVALPASRRSPRSRVR